MKNFIRSMLFVFPTLAALSASAADWTTDTKEALEASANDNKPLVVWFAKRGATVDLSGKALEGSIDKVILLKIEEGSAGAAVWKDSAAARLLTGEAGFAYFPA